MWILVPLATALLRSPEDLAFLERLKRREPDAAAELYDRYGRIVYSLVLRMVRNQAVAEELVQEAFLRVWHRSQFFDPEKGGFATWILAVARNQAIDYLRSVTGRQWKGEVAMDRMDEPALFQTIEEELIHTDRVRQIRSAIGKLKDTHRQVIELAYFEGLSQTEIAARISQPLGTVKTWMRTGLKLLRDELDTKVPA
ncbi:sigma-70 family RNA polymerase sigma factor [uncultured Paludibaculum sp.]|uniref:sigma-70 family RNA polymerase sigma factor n=1 Tax=uncultured Paludibaculum sp. TaxID=1765020 RepID=UPI002AAB63ED|nr:sigma-70 family RNA polymerase sigma factor [uncultured Paludibaculum sp.]